MINYSIFLSSIYEKKKRERELIVFLKGKTRYARVFSHFLTYKLVSTVVIVLKILIYPFYLSHRMHTLMNEVITRV